MRRRGINLVFAGVICSPRGILKWSCLSNGIRGSFQGFHFFQECILAASHSDIIACMGLKCVQVCWNSGAAVTEGYHFPTASTCSEVMRLCRGVICISQAEKQSEYSVDTKKWIRLTWCRNHREQYICVTTAENISALPWLTVLRTKAALWQGF